MDFALRELDSLIDPEPLITPVLLRTGEWIADYYGCGIETVIRSLLPEAVRSEENSAKTRRVAVLDAIRWHTVGFAEWDRTGRALYMADFLEPGRQFSRADRAFLADHLVHDFDGLRIRRGGENRGRQLLGE